MSFPYVPTCCLEVCQEYETKAPSVVFWKAVLVRLSEEHPDVRRTRVGPERPPSTVRALSYYYTAFGNCSVIKAAGLFRASAELRSLCHNRAECAWEWGNCRLHQKNNGGCFQPCRFKVEANGRKGEEQVKRFGDGDEVTLEHIKTFSNLSFIHLSTVQHCLPDCVHGLDILFHAFISPVSCYRTRLRSPSGVS